MTGISFTKQECIPVGCVSAAHWPYAGVCFPGGCTYSWGGVLSPGGCVCPRGCLLWGVSAQGGVCSRGVCSGGSVPAGVSAPRGCGIPACTEADNPPVDRITDACKTLPWSNFVAAGKDTRFNNWTCRRDPVYVSSSWAPVHVRVFRK